jgi:hypothetical protein
MRREELYLTDIIEAADAIGAPELRRKITETLAKECSNP